MNQNLISTFYFPNFLHKLTCFIYLILLFCPILTTQSNMTYWPAIHKENGGPFIVQCTFVNSKMHFSIDGVELSANANRSLKPSKRFKIDSKNECRFLKIADNQNIILRIEGVKWEDGAFHEDYLYKFPAFKKKERKNNSNCCPWMPPNLTGPSKVNKTILENINKLKEKFSMVKNWGHWPNKTINEMCKPIQRIAIIIPYRDRWTHLLGLLNNLHPFLQNQQAEYQIFVATQAYPLDGKIDRFNRGKLINAAFDVIYQHCNNCWDCFIFHDVDLVPANDRNLYRCGSGPIKLMFMSDEWPGFCTEINLAGANTQTAKQFKKANGFSNNFWGWGPEDEDLRERYRLSGQNVKFVKGPIGNYESLELVKKPKDTTNPKINSKCADILSETRIANWQWDGLSNLKYKLVNIEDAILYTNISMDLLMQESLQNHPCKDEVN